MRLGSNEANVIREEVFSLDPRAEIFLFGSRSNDASRGGDIDLLVISNHINFRDLLRLRRAIMDQIGWQQLDLVVRRADQLDEPFAAIARSEGIRL